MSKIVERRFLEALHHVEEAEGLMKGLKTGDWVGSVQLEIEFRSLKEEMTEFVRHHHGLNVERVKG